MVVCSRLVGFWLKIRSFVDLNTDTKTYMDLVILWIYSQIAKANKFFYMDSPVLISNSTILM